MKMSRKTMITSLIAVVLVGGGIGGGIAVHQSDVQAKQVAVEKKVAKIKADKKAEEALVSKAKAALLKAQKEDSIVNVSEAQKAVNALKKGSKAQKDGLAEIDEIHGRIKFEVEAKSAVETFKKDALNSEKGKVAHTAVNKLTNLYSKSLKDALNKQISASEAQAKASAAQTKAKQEADAKVKADAQAQADVANKEQQEANNQQNQAANNNTANGYTNSDYSNNTNGSSNSGYSNNTNGGGSNNNYSQNTQTPAAPPVNKPQTPQAPQTPQVPQSPQTSNKPSGGTGGGLADGSWSIDDANKAEEAAHNAGTGNAVNKVPGSTW